MKQGLCLLFLILVNWYGFGEKEYFRSNANGMLLEKIPSYRKDEYPYIIERFFEKEVENRVLLNENKAISRWEFTYYANQALKSEKEYKEQILQKAYFYNTARVLEEERFYTGGELTKKVLYFYQGKNQMQYAKAYDKEGNFLYEDNYYLTKKGGLREIRRTWNDNRFEKTAFIQGNGKLAQEIHADQDQTNISRFDDMNRLVIRETWKGENILEKQEYTYFADTNTIYQLREENFSTKLNSLKTYEKDGNLSSDVIEKDKKQVAVINYTWDNKGNKTEEREKNAAGLTVRKYYYNASDTLVSEEIYVRGSLELKTVYLEDENLYKEYYNKAGEAVIRIYYRDNVKFKEEILEKGQVIKTREIR